MKRKALKILIAAVVLLVVMALAALLAGRWLLQQPLQVTAAGSVLVRAGDSPTRVLHNLEQQGTLYGARWLGLFWRWRWQDPRLHQGEYAIAPEMTAYELLAHLRSGEVIQYRLTLVEGRTFAQWRESLSQAEKLDNDLAEFSDAEVMAQLGFAGQHPEGRFAPDTYTYTYGIKASELLRQPYQAQAKTLQSAWAERATGLPYKEPYQALIMASIIERETGVADEREEIAGVFVRRLQKGMLLQTDPTVIYGMGERYQGRITRADLRRPTPYNTYVISGLPPTPIAMPGRAAIEAALNPAAGKSLYLVAKGDGSHQFSNTLAEHNRAVRQYQLKRRADYRSSPAPRN